MDDLTLQATTMVDQYGLPITTGDVEPAGIVASDPNQTQNSGIISTLEGWGSSAVSEVESGASAALQAGESAVTTVYNAGKTVAGDAVNGVEGVVNYGTTTIIILVLALAIGLYIVGKGGLKVSAMGIG